MHLERLEILPPLHIYRNGFSLTEPAIITSMHQCTVRERERERERSCSPSFDKSTVHRDAIMPQIAVFENCINRYTLEFTYS